MYRFQVSEKKLIYTSPTVEPGEEVKEEWVLTHEVSVPDKETLGVIMRATAERLAPQNKDTYRS